MNSDADMLNLDTLVKRRKMSASPASVPFCCFNGGSDVWLDIGNKNIGVQILCEYLKCQGQNTLHVGDQVRGLI